MTNTRIKLFLAGCLVALASCDKNKAELPNKKIPIEAHATSLQKKHSDQAQSYQKPGANVRFKHNYDGATAVGAIEDLKLTFSEQYTSGQLYIRLKPDSGITIEPATQEFVFSLDSTQNHVLELSARATSAGKQFLNIFASVVDESGRVSNRVFAIAFYVDEKTLKQTKVQGLDRGEKVIILPSEEPESRL